MIGIVGASGFIGQHLTRYLRHRGHEVITLGRVGCQRHIKAVETMTQDDWAEVFTGLDSVVHLAAPAHSALPQALYEQQTLEALAPMIDGLKAAKVGRLVLLSSIKAQAGVSPTMTLSEDLPPMPEDAYGAAKLQAEQLALDDFANTVVLRPTLVYGPQVKGNLAQLQRLAELPVPLPFKAICAKRAMVHVANLNEAILLSLTTKAMGGQRFLVADRTEGYSLADLLRVLRQAKAKPAHLFSLSSFLLQSLLIVAGQGTAWSRLASPLSVSTAHIEAYGYQGRACLHQWFEADPLQDPAT